MELVKEILTELELIVDSIEQSRERPSDIKTKKNITQEKRKIILLKIK
ncbi:hypothetical protein [Okeania sp. SIO2G5]|nr:hypothetical protein [Okeania sp. SIO2G5]